MKIVYSLLYDNRLYYGEVEEEKEVKFGSYKKDNVYVESMSHSQLTIKNNGKAVSIISKTPFGLNLPDAPINKMLHLSNTVKATLYLDKADNTFVRKVKLPYNALISLGRKPNNDISVALPFVSGKHCTIKVETGRVRIEDNGSTNGLYVNGHRVSYAETVKSGDTVSIMTFCIKLINGELLFENTHGHITINIQNSDSVLDNKRSHENYDSLSYKRSPRIQERMPSEDIILSAPPSKGPGFEKGRGLFASVAGSGAMMLSSLAMGVVSPALFAARAAGMVVAPVANAVSSSGGNKRRKKRAEEYERMRAERYTAYIQSEKARIETIAEVQRGIVTRENPSTVDCTEVLYGLKRNLWARSFSDIDFLDVRIGMGYEDLCVTVKGKSDANGFQMESDEIKELSDRIIEETRIVDNVPLKVSFRKHNTVGVIGDRVRVTKLVKNLLVCLSTLHCYEDVRIVGIFDEDERKVWDSIKWLPHIWDENKQYRFLAYSRDDIRNLCELLTDIIKKRKDSLKENNSVGFPQSPHYILILGSKQLVEKESIMTELFSNNPEIGVTSIFLFNDIYSLPHGCRYIVDVNNNPSPFCYERDSINEKRFFTIDESLNDSQFDEFARFMSAIKLEGLSVAEPLPNGITFLQGYHCENVSGLGVTERWKNSTPYKSLAAPLGVLTGGKEFFFDIHEKAQGPHGLIAGTTGSGKSELLQTWILSMAINYHPHDVNFVLIDYKGGGMASLLEPLPHVVGKITNISSNISRSLISLQSEVQRRQRLFEKNNVNHIDKYQRLYKMGNTAEPLPHLIIVADEFAELKKAEPDFMAGLISVSRVGRSLGIHLVLATQKPAGVVDDQIQSNSRFRLCLKVQDVSDSREMIKRPDAAKITQAGRTFIRVGEDEYFELFQSFWSGAPYFGSALDTNDVGNQVRFVQTNGQRIKTVQDEKTRFKSDLDELTAVVNYIVGVAKKEGINKLQGPWMPELPERIPLDSLLINSFDGTVWPDNSPWLKATVGLYDCPQSQSQGPVELDFSEKGSYAVYGAPSTGKTTFLKTLAMSLCKTFTPEEVNLYFIDCGGWSMSIFTDMPHVGGVALDCENEKILKLEQLLLDELDKRKRLFYSHSVSSYEAYRQMEYEACPAIFLLVDNIASMFDLYPDLESTFITLSREGANYGIYLVYTANSTTGVRYKVMQNIKGAIAFELNDKGDYSAIVGRLDGLSLPKIIGRGFVKGNPPIEFQSALYATGDDEKQRVGIVRKTAFEMNAVWKGKTATPIPIMPDHITFENVRSAFAERTVIPLGINYSDIKMTSVDLGDNYSFLVTGGISSGKSEYLQGLLKLVSVQYPTTRIYVFDSTKHGLSASHNFAYKYSEDDKDDVVSEMISEIIEQLNLRKRAQNLARQKEISSFDEKSFIRDYELIVIAIDDLKEFIDTVTDNSKNSIERICRLAQNLGVIVLVAGRISDIARYNEIESLTRVIIGNQNGIGLSDTPAMYSFFHNNLKFTEKEIDVGEGNGYLFIKGKCTKIKLFE
jgi:S-DNA-T family DNA segregation ATPase FtsK/SpoIIIE